MSAPHLFASHAVAARIEAADTHQLTRCYEAVAKHLPQRRAAMIEVGGGAAPFVGKGLSLSRAVGLGMSGPVTDEDLDALEALYQQHESDADIGVCPYADQTLFDGLGRRGFRLLQLDTLLALRIAPGTRFPPPAEGVTVRVAAPDEGPTWVRASIQGFSGSDSEVPEGMAETFEAAFHVLTSSFFFAAAAGVLAGTAGVDLHAGTASLFGASTFPGSRGRGVQAALVHARLAAAEAAGCDLAFTRTSPGSPSQRNLERLGFRPVYSRARLVKSYDNMIK
jgi:GNAT superfamily N-acetyltransferase